MSEPKDQTEAAFGGSDLTAELGADTPRVEARALFRVRLKAQL